jgi:tRNA dimethylallyltransferase
MEEMLAFGLMDEAQQLYPNKHLNALQTLGYTEIFDYLDNRYDYNELVRLLKQNSRRYAKRQLTWFGKDKEFVSFRPNQKEEIISYIQECIKKAPTI